LDVLAACEAAGPGEKGAIVRREGLYSSHLTVWRWARDAGALAGLTQPRGRRRADPRDGEAARLVKEDARLERELAKARFVVDVQGKLQALLEKLSESADTQTRSRK
jgi:transposase